MEIWKKMRVGVFFSEHSVELNALLITVSIATYSLSAFESTLNSLLSYRVSYRIYLLSEFEYWIWIASYFRWLSWPRLRPQILCSVFAYVCMLASDPHRRSLSSLVGDVLRRRPIPRPPNDVSVLRETICSGSVPVFAHCAVPSLGNTPIELLNVSCLHGHDVVVFSLQTRQKLGLPTLTAAAVNSDVKTTQRNKRRGVNKTVRMYE